MEGHRRAFLGIAAEAFQQGVELGVAVGGDVLLGGVVHGVDNVSKGFVLFGMAGREGEEGGQQDGKSDNVFHFNAVLFWFTVSIFLIWYSSRASYWVRLSMW